MLCLHCQIAIKKATRNFDFRRPRSRRSSEAHILHRTPQTLIDSIAQGCFICQNIKTAILAHEVSRMPVDGQLGSWGSATILSNINAYRDLERLLSCGVMTRAVKRYSISRVPIRFHTRVSNGYQILICPERLSLNVAFELSPAPEIDTSLIPTVKSGLIQGSTRDSQKRWQQWLRTCTDSHPKCRVSLSSPQSFLPDRLVEIQCDDCGNPCAWRLVQRADIGVVPYLTLSHCWGESEHLRLVKDNHLAFLHGYNESALPKTYRHAFIISAALGFQFIWIDSLCIIQDDLHDWKVQSSLMGSIYKHASCNIAATWAKDGKDGCFHARDPSNIDQTSIQLKVDSGKACNYYVSKVDDVRYHDDIENGPLNQRGWVAQERHLARKQLSFTKNQVYWECLNMLASEQFPQGLPRHLWMFGPLSLKLQSAGKPTMDYQNRFSLRSSWISLVNFYSGCILTQTSDKLIAIAGLAAEYRATTGDVYLAGHWRNNLEMQLNWATDFEGRSDTDCSRPSAYRAPTWSWASVDGPVLSDWTYLHSPEEQHRRACLVEVLDVSIQSEDNSQLHSFSSAELVLRGVAVWARVLSQKGYRATVRLESENSAHLTEVLATVLWDERSSLPVVDQERYGAKRKSKLLFMLSKKSGGSLEGRVLHRVLGCADTDAFTRVGLFYLAEDEGVFAHEVLNVSGAEEITLNNAHLARFVHTVTVV